MAVINQLKYRIIFLAFILFLGFSVHAFSHTIFLHNNICIATARADIKLLFSAPLDLNHGYELWNNRGIAYVFRDDEARVINFASFKKFRDEHNQKECVKLCTPDNTIILLENKNTVSIKGPLIPFMTSKGVFIKYLTPQEAESKLYDMQDLIDFSVTLGTLSKNSIFRQGDPISPGQEQYNAKAETQFHKMGYEVLGNVQPWSHNLVNGNNILISRSQKIKVDFKGPFTQNFYIFRANKIDKTGLLFWFSGNFGYSGKSITIPVEGGWYYGFCSDTPKTQPITVNWDNRP